MDYHCLLAQVHQDSVHRLPDLVHWDSNRLVRRHLEARKTSLVVVWLPCPEVGAASGTQDSWRTKNFLSFRGKKEKKKKERGIEMYSGDIEFRQKRRNVRDGGLVGRNKEAGRQAGIR